MDDVLYQASSAKLNNARRTWHMHIARGAIIWRSKLNGTVITVISESRNPLAR